MKRICEMEFTDTFIILYYSIIFIIMVVLGIAVVGFVVHFLIFLGSFKPTVEVNNPKQPSQIEQQTLQPPQISYEFQIEPEKVSYPVGCEYWYGYINTIEATEEEKAWLSRIAKCESTCNPYAVSKAGAYGLYQYMSKTWNWMGGGDINDPYQQLDKALSMYRKGMQGHWCCDKI